MGATEPLDVWIRRDGSRTLVAVRGELDLATVSKLAAAVDPLVSSSTRQLVLDLRELEFIDVAGLRLASNLHALAVAAGCDFALVRGPRAVHRVFEMTLMDERLTFVTEPSELAQSA